MVYDWDNKRDACYDMYITQNKSLEETISHFRDDKNFTPSKRAFQARFKGWGFPAKHHPAHKEASLTARIRELWEVNTTNKQMFDLLRGEGWDLKERELTNLRKEQGLLLREANRRGHGKRKRDALYELADQNEQQGEDDGPAENSAKSPTPEAALSPEIIAKRQARQARIAAESEELRRARKRRRRTKVWAGLPPDPEQEPRFPSELTMEESKRELGLDKTLYQELRDIFEDICRAKSIIKKTYCGPDIWKSSKEELIGRMPHLMTIFWGAGAAGINETRKPMALDLICMDVTKKIRTVSNRVTITDAKNILGVTPQEAREIRASFDAILKADHFTSKLEVPREYWNSLKEKWINQSPLLQQKLGDQETDPDYHAKSKALESMACDVQKRHRDEQTRKDPTRLRNSLVPEEETPQSRTIGRPSTNDTSNQSTGQSRTRVQNQSPSHRDVMPVNPPMAYSSNDTIPSTLREDGMTTLASQALASASYPYDHSGMQIDPSLLQAASLPQQNYSRNYNHTSPETATARSAVPVFFRISPSSPLKHLTSAKKVWLDTFNPPYTVVNLRNLALNRSGLKGNGDARVGKVDGVQSAAEGSEGGRWGIDDDDELEAFLRVVEQGGKATFVVEIV